MLFAGTDHPLWPEVVRLRQRVFGEEQGISEESRPDPDDAHSIHALATIETPDSSPQAVGTGRLTVRPAGQQEALIAWVATLPEARRHGVGGAVMRALLAEADAAGTPRVALAAQRHAESFYLELGFTPVGVPYTVRGIPHRWMTRQRPEPLDI
ncbi:MAG: GNAT family N-acetyltransferase [Thermomicrobiales bacterium]|nr:GNAT family N-acetyltransferase [Thermomicrobiales bacterium]